MNYFNIVVVVISIDFLINQILKLLNLLNHRTDIPVEIEAFCNKDNYIKSISYQKERVKLSLLSSTVKFILTIGILYIDGFAWLDSLLQHVTVNPIPLALLFSAVILLGSELLTIFFLWYREFVIDTKYGFNVINQKEFIVGNINYLWITAIRTGIPLAFLVYLIVTVGPSFWIWFAISFWALHFCTVAIYPTLILPLFNDLEPLPDGELKSAIFEYTSTVGFAIEKVMVLDKSRQSKRSGALLCGFGKHRRIILYDTLIHNHTTTEIVAIIAHEMGHFKKSHIIGSFVLFSIHSTLFLYILSVFVFDRNLPLALGGSTLSINLNLLAFALLYSPLSTLWGLIHNVISRRREYEADMYAKLTYDATSLSNALKKLYINNLINFYPHPLSVLFSHSHPPLLKRLKALEAGDNIDSNSLKEEL